MVKSGTYAGIALDDGLIEAAVARVEERGVAIERRTARPAGEDPGAAAAAPWSPPLPRAVSVGLPSAHAMIRVATFPTRDPAEWRAMALLDAENYAPLQLDQLYIGIEEAAAVESATRVWIALIPRTPVDDLGAAFRKTSAPPTRVDLNLLAWWELWRETTDAAADERRIALRLAGGNADIIVLDHGRPVSAAGLRVSTPAELAVAVARRLAATEWEHGPAAVARAVVWRRAADTAAWPEAEVRAALRDGAGIESAEFRALPEGAIAEGLARRAARADSPALNLAPDDWRTERAARQRRRSVLRAAAAVALAWAAGLGVLYGALRWRRAAVAEEQARAEALRGPADAALELRDRLRSFEGYAARTRSALEALREVTEQLPPEVELNSFTYRKHTTVALRGSAARAEAIYDFLQSLEQSPFFTKIESGEVRSRGAGAARRSEFNVTAHLPGREGATP